LATNPNFVRIYNPKTGESKEVHVNAANGQYKLDGWTTTPPATTATKSIAPSVTTPKAPPQSLSNVINKYNELNQGYAKGAITEKEYDALRALLPEEGFYNLPFKEYDKPTNVAPTIQPQEVSFRDGYTSPGNLQGAAGTSMLPSTQARGSALRSAEELAKMYGNITYDEDAILSKFNDATEKEYAAKRKEYEQTEDEFYTRLFGTQSTALDTIRRANSSAITTGASQGFQAANEIAAILGLQQESVDDSTKLAQARTNLVDKEAEAYTKNAVDALTTANTIKQALATIGSNLYAADTQLSVGQLQYLAQLDAAAKQLEASLYGSDAQKDIAGINMAGQLGVADKNLLGTLGAATAAKEANIYAADQNYAGNYINALANLLGVQTTAASNLEGTKYAADRNKEGIIGSAEKNNAAQKAYYDYMKSNEGSSSSGSGYGNSSDLLTQINNALASGQEGIAVALMMAYAGVDQNEARELLGLIQKRQPIIPDILGISTPLPPKEGEAPGKVSKGTLVWYSLMYALKNGVSYKDAIPEVVNDFYKKGYTLPLEE
jgi:hypothetical protein